MQKLPADSATKIEHIYSPPEVYAMVFGKDCDWQIGPKAAHVILQQRLRARSAHEIVRWYWKIDER
jgi:hypothetical protein